MRMISATLLWAPFCAVSAQTQPNIAEILQKISDTYKNVSQYEFVNDLTAHDPRTQKDLPGHTRFAFRSPNKYRMEMEGAVSSGPGPGLMVHDGSNLWIYMRDSNQYIVISADKLAADAPGDLGDAGPEAMDHFVMWRYRGATDFAGNAKFLREETIEFSGARVDCYVVAVFPNGKTAYTWWVAKSRYVILREDDAGNSAVFKTIKLNEPLADDLFQFVPPAGARKIELQ